MSSSRGKALNAWAEREEETMVGTRGLCGSAGTADEMEMLLDMLPEGGMRETPWFLFSS